MRLLYSNKIVGAVKAEKVSRRKNTPNAQMRNILPNELFNDVYNMLRKKPRWYYRCDNLTEV